MERRAEEKFAVARTLREIASLLDLAGESVFKRRAYLRAADAIEAASDFGERVREGRLTELEGVGDKLAAQITEIWRTGRSSTAERLASGLPTGATELARVPGLTVRRIRALQAALGTSSIDEVREACEAGRVRTVPGFGPKTEARILEAIRAHEERPAHVRLAEAVQLGEELAAYLRQSGAFEHVELAGEVRRACEVVGELVFLGRALEERTALEAFARMPRLVSVDDERTGGRLSNGVGVRLILAGPSGLALLFATGPEEHVRELLRRAPLEALEAATSERRVYERAGLPFIPPELRDAPGVIERAARGERFDDLVQRSDVRGFVHCHTVHSDGKDTILAMARAAEARGAEYITITDHSQSAFYAGGMSIQRLERQWEEIAEAQHQVSVRLLRGIESDILGDGSLDYPDAILERLDVIIASIHGRMRMDETEMTRRLERMLRLPQFKIWGHALGRLLLRRPPISCKLERLLDVAAESRVAIEVNGDPYRLDLPPEWIRVARTRGIPFVLSTDAHATRQLDYLAWSTLMARRGGLRKHEILNTLGAEEFARAVRPTEVRHEV